ncbi:MAG: hypothetical protein DUD32_05990 [Lactobacillus sp.]|nr:MAG: hypothetical protein DUD32_05990 [Lactobacillus sp.]
MQEEQQFGLVKQPSFDGEKVNLTMILSNGADLLAKIKKAQRLNAELQTSLERIKNFEPRFHLEESKQD